MRFGAILVAVAMAVLLPSSNPPRLKASTQVRQSPKTSRSAGELDQLVAPIALYPDALLVQLLMAATYPLEIVQADRWAKANKSLQRRQARRRFDQAGLGRQREGVGGDADRAHHDE